MDKQVICFVSSKGVFTLLSVSTKPPELNDIYKIPAGFQCNPATKIWIRINVSSDYGWTIAGGNTLFEVERNGSSTLMHVFKSASYAEATTPF
ncbi:hypothetical protein BGZ81_011167, partial [Podila clonocystis]